MGLENTFFAIVTRMKFISRWSVMRNSYTQNVVSISWRWRDRHAHCLHRLRDLGRDSHPELDRRDGAVT